MIVKAIQAHYSAFRRDWIGYIQKYHANIAGFMWNCGNFTQLPVAIAAHSLRVGVSFAFNCLSSTSYNLFAGKKKWGIPVGVSAAVVGTFLAQYPVLENNLPDAKRNFAIFLLAQMFGLLKTPLMQLSERMSDFLRAKKENEPRTFAVARKAVCFAIKHTIGQPLAMMGIITLVWFRIPVIGGLIRIGHASETIPFFVWGIGDLFICADLFISVGMLLAGVRRKTPVE